MLGPNDPRVRQALDHVQQNLEAAGTWTQESLYAFSQQYLKPCLASTGECFHSWTEPCFPTDEDQRRRRHRGRPYGGAESSFDFYDNWDQDQDDLVGWGNDELEHLLASPDNDEPRRERAMNYGAARIGGLPRRKSAIVGHDVESDPTILPTSSYFGFLERLPWRSKGVRYKPSAADLQEHPGSGGRMRGEGEAVFDGDEEEEFGYQSARGHKRVRSNTNTSGQTIDSLSSRGDIFPSEDELDDAVPLDDEFASAFERRATGDLTDGGSGTRSNRGSSRSRLSMRTASSRSSRSMQSTRHSSQQRLEPDVYIDTAQPLTLTEMKAEEDALVQEEEELIMMKRRAAQDLALKRGLSSSDVKSHTSADSPASPVPEVRSTSPASKESSTPFPAFDPARTPGMVTPSDEREGPDLSSPTSPATPTPAARTKSPPPEFVPAALPFFGRREG